MVKTFNDYVKKSSEQYVKNINKDTEYKNKKHILFGEKPPKIYVYDKNYVYGENSLVKTSVFILSLTTILYYFYSNKN